MFSHLGTWSDGSICKVCGEHTSILIEPLLVEWEPGTDRIGSFSWCGYTSIVPDDVRRYLEESDFECEFGRIEVVPPTTRSRMPRVPYPYTGPGLHWLRPTVRLPANESRSGISLKSDCATCGQKRYTFKREGLVIDAASWSGEKIFEITQNEPSGATFVTEQALDDLAGQGFTNLAPKPAGTIE